MVAAFANCVRSLTTKLTILRLVANDISQESLLTPNLAQTLNG